MPTNTPGQINTALNTAFPPQQGAALRKAFAPTLRADLRTQQSYTSDATVGDISDLTITVENGKRYAVTVVAHCTGSAAGGIQLDLGGGSATVTSIAGNALINSAAAVVGVAVAALTTALTSGAIAALQVRIEATILVNTGGTLIVRGAQAVSNGSASTVNVGSYIEAVELPA